MWLYTYSTKACFIYQMILTEQNNLESCVWYKLGINISFSEPPRCIKNHFSADYLSSDNRNWKCRKLRKNDPFFLEVL